MSNSKSEDTLDEKVIRHAHKWSYVSKAWKHCSGCDKWKSISEPPQDTSLNDTDFDRVKKVILDSEVLDEHDKNVGGDLYSPEGNQVLTAYALAQYIVPLFAKERAKLFEQIRSEVIGGKEFYSEHYPFVVTKDQHIEMKEKLARDDLRAEQLEALNRLEGAK